MNRKKSDTYMEIIMIIAVPLITWWIAIAILVARDKARQLGSIAAIPEPHPSHSPIMPLWPSRADYVAQPTLFLTVLWCALMYALVCFLVWPAFLIRPRPKRRGSTMSDTFQGPRP
jgi:hypothetical protein